MKTTVYANDTDSGTVQVGIKREEPDVKVDRIIVEDGPEVTVIWVDGVMVVIQGPGMRGHLKGTAEVGEDSDLANALRGFLATLERVELNPQPLPP